MHQNIKKKKKYMIKYIVKNNLLKNIKKKLRKIWKLEKKLISLHYQSKRKD